MVASAYQYKPYKKITTKNKIPDKVSTDKDYMARKGVGFCFFSLESRWFKVGNSSA